MKLIDKPVSRIFSFGCSFTKYTWATWPEIIAYDLNIPLYNYGRSGAGNQYIANMISQANLFHKFNEHDLIMVAWTNVCREDRWKDGDWITPGNIFTQGEYDQKYIKRWSDPVGYMVRDFSSIHFVNNLLEKIGCQHHIMSMCDIAGQIDQNGDKFICSKHTEDNYKNLCELYKNDLEKILPSFFKTLWNNDIHKNKMLVDQKIPNNRYADGHPRPEEHFQYLKTIFADHQFDAKTEKIVEEVKNRLLKFLIEVSDGHWGGIGMYSLSDDTQKYITGISTIRESLDIDQL